MRRWPYEYVTYEEALEIEDSLRNRNLEGSDLVSSLKALLGGLEQQRRIEQHKDEGPPLMAKAAIIGVPKGAADTLRGVGMEKAAQNVEQYIDKDWEEQVAAAQAGPITNLDTWTSNIGSMIPMMAAAALTRGVSMRAAAALGAGTKVAGAAGIAAPALGFAAQSKGATLKMLKDSGVDDDIANDLSTPAGVVNGVLSEASMLGALTPFKMSAAVMDKALESNPLVKAAAKQLGITSLMGANQAGMSMVNDYVLRKAMDAMRQRHGAKWAPPVEQEKPDLVREVVLGAGVGTAGRLGSTLVSVPSQYTALKKQAKESYSAEGKAVFESMGKLDESGKDTFVVERPNVHIDVAQGQKLHEQWLKEAAKPETAGKKYVAGEWKDMTEQERSISIDRNIENMTKDQAARWVNTIRKRTGQAPVDPAMMDDTTLKAELRANYDITKEGPRWSHSGPDKVLELRPVLSDKVLVVDTEWGSRVGKLYDTMYPKAIQLKVPTKPVEAVKTEALKYAGLDEQMASHPDLVHPRIGMESWMQFMGDKLTRQQYAALSNHVEGVARSEYSRTLGRDAALRTSAILYAKGLRMPDFRDADGKSISYPKVDIGPIALQLAAWKMRPLNRVIDQLGRAGFKTAMDVDQAIVEGNHVHDQTLMKIQAAHHYIWDNIPKELGRGVQRGYLNDLVFYIKNNPETRALKSKQLGLEGVAEGMGEKVLAKRILDTARYSKMNEEQVIKLAREVSDRYKVISDWAARQGELDPAKVIDNYFPLIHEYMAEGGAFESGIPAAQYFKSRRDYFKKIKSVTDVDGEISRIVRMVDVANSMASQDKTNLGQGTPFYEFARAQDREFLREVRTVTDPFQQYDMMIRRMLKRKIYEDMAPSIHAVMTNLVHDFEMSGKPGYGDAIKLVMHDYLNSAMGMPETMVSVARKLNLVDHTTIAGRMHKSLTDTLNKHFGRYYDFSGAITTKDLESKAMSFMYPMLLGLPFNMRAPIENLVSQMPMSMAFGAKSTVRAAARLLDPHDSTTRDAVNELGLHTVTQDVDIQHIMSKQTRAGTVGSIAMSAFAKTDLMGRHLSAASAMENWRMLEPLLKADPKLEKLTKEQVGSILFRGTSPSKMGIDDAKLINANSSMKQLLGKGGAPKGFSTIEDWVYRRLMEGNVDEAKRGFIRYGVDLANFRYGRAGTAPIYAGALKPILMLTSYPSQWLEWQAMFWNPKNQLLKQLLTISAGQWALMSAVAVSGVSVSRMGMLGPLPARLGATGPLLDYINSVLNVVSTTTQDMQSELLPVSSEESDMLDRRRKAALKHLETVSARLTGLSALD